MVPPEQCRLNPELWSSVSRGRAKGDLLCRVCRQPDHRQADVKVAADALIATERTSTDPGSNQLSERALTRGLRAPVPKFSATV